MIETDIDGIIRKAEDIRLCTDFDIKTLMRSASEIARRVPFECWEKHGIAIEKELDGGIKIYPHNISYRYVGEGFFSAHARIREQQRLLSEVAKAAEHAMPSGVSVEVNEIRDDGLYGRYMFKAVVPVTVSKGFYEDIERDAALFCERLETVHGGAGAIVDKLFCCWHDEYGDYYYPMGPVHSIWIGSHFMGDSSSGANYKDIGFASLEKPGQMLGMARAVRNYCARQPSVANAYIKLVCDYQESTFQVVVEYPSKKDPELMRW